MAPEDLRMLCTALGFAALVVKGGERRKDGARRALRLAGLIEEFCLSAAPPPTPIAQIDAMIEQIKSGLRAQGEADMDKDRRTLSLLYARLAQRAGRYASDNVLADLALGLLDAEMFHEDAGGERIS